ncbi:NAD(P)-dependent oxidoreductase [Microbacterium sp. X-17]|uniref:NAD(P)-dependent oxidoreductase n=1 Tax=Microbacterium sp. X-17 TaxID=3144404 RepID=UPI0031F4D04A
MSDITVIGLGAMGTPIARNLLDAGYQVTVWNRSPEPAHRIAMHGARVASGLEDALRSPVVISMLSNDEAVADVLLDSGVLRRAAAGTVHVNMATVSTTLAERAAEIHAGYGLGYVAAPVFGRVPVAEAGALNVLAAGDRTLITAVQPFFDVIGSRTWVIGEEPAQANAIKVMGNYLVASAIQSLGETIAVAERTGIDPARVVELLTSTLFPGPVYSAYGHLIAERHYQPAGFTTILGRKDVHLALDAAANVGVTLPFGEVLREVFDDAISQGRSLDDWAAIAELRR